MVTQRELAKLAGVSAGTVSNVISGSTRVSEDARRKVLDAIRVLKYQPNLIARSLRTNRIHTLGIVVPDLTIPFFPKIVRGAEYAARERGYFLIVSASTIRSPTFRSSTRTHLQLSVSRAIVLTSNSPHLFRT